jgi:hypothetical protein
VHLKHGYCMLIHFIHGYYCIYRPWQPLTYLYFPYHCISLIYFSFTMIRMFLYAQMYWLAEFGDVSSLQFNYLRVETLTPTGRIWSDICRTIWSDICRCEVRQNSLSDLSVWSLTHLEGSAVHSKCINDQTLRSDKFLPKCPTNLRVNTL